jgi:hypothetical protein
VPLVVGPALVMLAMSTHADPGLVRLLVATGILVVSGILDV